MANSAIGNGTIVGGTQTFITNTDESASLPNSVQLSLNTNTAVAVKNGAAQSIPNNTFTKVVFDTENFDLNSDFDTTTYRHTPTIAGTYLYTINLFLTTTATTSALYNVVYLNGVARYYSVSRNASAGNADQATQVAVLIEMNGSTDYVESFVYQNSGVNKNLAIALSLFNAVKVDA